MCEREDRCVDYSARRIEERVMVLHIARDRALLDLR